MEGEIWGEASVSFPDWSGTAQLDERMTVPWKGLARTIGLDSAEWQVVGFSIGGGELGYDLQVVATPRDVWDKVKPGDDSEIEVTEFLIHGVDPLVILREMTHVFELKMRIRSVKNNPIRIRALSDRPTELFVTEQFGPQDEA